MNNTPYTMYTSSQSQYGQIYTAHGEIVVLPVPTIPAASPNPPAPTPGNLWGSTYLFTNDDAAAVGPAGAFWVQIEDPNQGNVLGGLCIAYWVPVTGKNGIAVGFNQTLQTRFDSFSGPNATLQTNATLPAQQINGVNYPQLTAKSDSRSTGRDLARCIAQIAASGRGEC